MSSLTEDYEFGIRLQEFDVEQVFVNQAIERVRTFRSRVTGRQRVSRVREYIATRELFPERFRDAVKQKGRWVTGIALQGWGNLGWPGGLGGKYMLFRDRKSLLTNQVNMLGYGLLLVVLLLTRSRKSSHARLARSWSTLGMRRSTSSFRCLAFSWGCCRKRSTRMRSTRPCSVSSRRAWPYATRSFRWRSRRRTSCWSQLTRPPVPAERQQIEEAIDPPVKWCLATRGDVAFAIRRGFERLAAGEPAVRSSKLLGRELVSQNLLTEAQLKEALKEQRSSYGRLGACLVELGLLTGAALDRALGEYEGGGYFGEFLVHRQYLRSDQVQEGLALQQGRSRTLG